MSSTNDPSALEEKIRTLEQLIAADPNDPDLPFLLGKALLDAKQFEASAARLDQAANLNPNLAAIWRFWGEALLGAGDPEAARTIWTDGIAVAERTGELQAGKEMNVLRRRHSGKE